MINLINKNLKEILNNKKIIIASIVIITIIGIFAGFSKKSAKNTEVDAFIKVGVIDEDNSIYSKLLLEYFEGNEDFKNYINIVKGNLGDIEELFQAGEIDALIRIPPRFIESLIYIENKPLYIRINGKNPLTSIVLKNVLESYEKYISSVEINTVNLYDLMTEQSMDQKLIDETNIKISYDLVFTALGRENIFNHVSMSGYPNVELTHYYIASFLAILIMYWGLSVGLDLLRENKDGTLQRYMVMHKSMFSFVFAKILVSAFFVLLLSLVGYLILVVLSGIKFNLSVCLIYTCFVLFFITLGALLSGFFRNRNAYVITGNMMYLMLIIIGGGLIPIMYLPEQLAKLAKITPNYWFIRQILSFSQNRNFIQCSMIFLGVIIVILGMAFLLCSIYRRREGKYE